MSTRELIQEIIDREIDEAEKAARQVKQGEELNPDLFFRSALKDISGSRLSTESSIPLLQQLCVHDVVRLPIRAISAEEFTRLYGLQIPVAEMLVSRGLLLPVLTHRNASDWTKDYPHLHGLIELGVSSGHRYDIYLRERAAKYQLDYENLEAEIQQLMDRHLTQMRAEELAAFEQPYAFHVVKNSCVKRLLWLSVEYPEQASELRFKIERDEPDAFKHLRLIYHHKISPIQTAMNGIVCMDKNVAVLHSIPEATGYNYEQANSHSPEIMQACQALMGGEKHWPMYVLPDFQNRPAQFKVADALIKLHDTKHSEVRARLRKTLEKIANEIAEGNIKEDSVLTALRDSDHFSDIMKESSKRLDMHARVLGGVSTLAIQSTCVLAGMGLGIMRPYIDPWVAKTLQKMNKSLGSSTTQLISVIQEVKNL